MTSNEIRSNDSDVNDDLAPLFGVGKIIPVSYSPQEPMMYPITTGNSSSYDDGMVLGETALEQMTNLTEDLNTSHHDVPLSSPQNVTVFDRPDDSAQTSVMNDVTLALNGEPSPSNSHFVPSPSLSVDSTVSAYVKKSKVDEEAKKVKRRERNKKAAQKYRKKKKIEREIAIRNREIEARSEQYRRYVEQSFDFNNLENLRRQVVQHAMLHTTAALQGSPQSHVQADILRDEIFARIEERVPGFVTNILSELVIFEKSVFLKNLSV